MNDSESELQQAGCAAFDSGRRVLDLMGACLPACSIDAAKVRRITITQLADTLVRDENLTCRQAHDIAGDIARRLDGAPLSDGFDGFQSAVLRATDRPPSLTTWDFVNATNARTFVARRDRIGGPALAILPRALDHSAQDLGSLRAAATMRTRRLDGPPC